MSRYSGAEEHDPAGVQALLNLLRDQQDQGGAQQGASTPTTDVYSTLPSSTAPHYHPARSSAPSRSAVPHYVPDGYAAGLTTGASQGYAQHSYKPAPDLRNVSFAQSLPILKQLAQDEEFLTALVNLKLQQDKVEQELAKGRKKLADAMQSAPSDASGANEKGKGKNVTKEQLAQYDRKILEQWDRLTGNQQERLEKLGVPCFFRTTRKADLKRQDQVMRMLSDFMDVYERDNTEHY